MSKLKLVPKPTFREAPEASSTASAEGGLVFIVDDRATARNLLEGLARSLGPDIRVESFADPKHALSQARRMPPDLVITDYRMPSMNGVEFTRHLRAEKSLEDVPIVIITVVEDRLVRQQALESGATDFLTRPIDPYECRARFRNLLNLRQSQKNLRDRAQWLETQVAKATQDIHARERETLIKLAKAGEYRDEHTGNHIYRMAQYSRLIAEEIGLSGLECEEIELTAPMHDLGKIGIPDHILLKPGPLTPHEMLIMQTHPVIGYDILKDSPSPFLSMGAMIALHHHERYDGSGYPHHLAGQDIPLPARIVAVADVFDALTSERPYKRPWRFEAAVEYVRNSSTSHFDPDCAAAFLKRLDDVREIMRRYRDSPEDERK
jgi:two-component system response regulator RpfG